MIVATGEMIPVISIIFMAISAFIAIALPLGLFLGLKKRFGLKAVPMLTGTAAFIIFALILEQILHVIVLRPGLDGSIALLSSNPALYALYGVFAAGVFEETARFLSFKLLKKKYHGIGTALSYGIGHGGIEAVLILGMSMVANAIVSIIYNMGFSTGIEEAARILIDTQPYMFLVGGFERICVIVIQIALSIIVWYSVEIKSKWWLYPAAILLHAAIDVPAVLMQIGVIQNIFIVEGLVALCAVGLTGLAVLTCKKLNSSVQAAE